MGWVPVAIPRLVKPLQKKVLVILLLHLKVLIWFSSQQVWVVEQVLAQFAVAAKIAKALGAVTVGIVSTPFSFEMGRRQRNANDGLNKLRPYSDTLISVPNDKLLHVAPKDLPMELAFRLADDVLRQGIQGIAELITMPGLINVDFSHVRNVMQMGGGSLLSMGQGEGLDKARKAIDQALHHPLLESVNLYSAGGIIANFTGGRDLSFLEVTDALSYLQDMTGNRADVIPGFMIDERLTERAQVILIVTGLGGTAIDKELFAPRNTEAKNESVPSLPIEVRETVISLDMDQPSDLFASPAA